MAKTQIVKGVQFRPFAACVYGPEGVGKTSLASAAPDAIVFDFEGGSNQLDTARVYCETIAEFDEALVDPDVSRFKTYVIDSADWLESLLAREVCAAGNKASIADFGFGKGEEALLNKFKGVLAKLTPLRPHKNIIFTAHSQIKTFKNPMSEDYDRYGMKLAKKCEAILKEWCDTILFYTYKDVAKKATGETKVRTYGDGLRVIYTEHRPAFDAKNRFGLDFEIEVQPDNLSEVWQYMVPRIDFNELRQEILTLSAGLPADLLEKVKVGIEHAGDDTRRLSAIKKWATEKATAAAKAAATVPAVTTSEESKQ